jgi:hypothetical protein
MCIDLAATMSVGVALPGTFSFLLGVVARDNAAVLLGHVPTVAIRNDVYIRHKAAIPRPEPPKLEAKLPTVPTGTCLDVRADRGGLPAKRNGSDQERPPIAQGKRRNGTAETRRRKGLDARCN